MGSSKLKFANLLRHHVALFRPSQRTLFLWEQDSSESSSQEYLPNAILGIYPIPYIKEYPVVVSKGLKYTPDLLSAVPNSDQRYQEINRLQPSIEECDARTFFAFSV
jgi:hypothetical protein